MKSIAALFLATFLVSFLVQISYFQTIYFGDNLKWVERVENLSHDIFERPIHIDFKNNQDQFRYGGHPGTTILLPAAIAYRFGADPQTALTTAIVFLTAIATASIVTTCYFLRPSSQWWLAAGFIITIHPLYFYSTPANAVIAPLITLLSLLTYLVFTTRHQNKPLPQLAFAATLGACLATRIPITIFIGAPLLTFIYPYLPRRRFLTILGGSLITAYLLIPFLWLMPLEFLKIVVLRTSSHLVFTGAPGFSLTPGLFLMYAPLTVISFIMIGLLLIVPRYKPPLDIKYLLVLILITGFTTAIFVAAKFHSLRYFFPVIFIWDILLPLFLLHLSSSFRLDFITSSHAKETVQKIIRVSLIAIVLFSYGYLTLYNIVLPGPQGLI